VPPARLRFAAVVLVLLPLLASGADAREEQLARVRARLQSLQSELNLTRNQRDAVREEISGLERQIGAALNQLRDTERQLKREEKRLRALHEDAAQQRKQLDRQRDGLARQVRAQYAAGRQEQLKLLLTQQDPALAARVLTYYRYLHRARAERIVALQSGLTELRETETQLETKQRELQSLRETQRRAKNELDSSRARRGVLLASLDRRAGAQARELERLREDETRLTRLLQEITTAYAELPLPRDVRDVRGPFGTLKGKLTLPAKGRLTARYGEPKAVGNLKWRGVFLAAEDATAVRAVARGRVAYADWLRGFGLLLILEHGDGYMTLYGHNQSLIKQAGEWADAGETIARVGNTGDAPQSGLYFEIRHNGEPRDPLLWCRLR
jgi:septal ring factor EnvC (AmiA/AmiB activator)